MELVLKTTEIELTKNSGLDQLDWDNLPFGKVFSDHMFSMRYENGEWQQPKILAFEDIKMSPATSVLHYGQSCFEGMKANRNKDEVEKQSISSVEMRNARQKLAETSNTVKLLEEKLKEKETVINKLEQKNGKLESYTKRSLASFKEKYMSVLSFYRYFRQIG